MYNLDSLTLKFWLDENLIFLKNAVAQKIQMPSRREILLSLRNLGENKKLYINVDPKFAHLNFIDNKGFYDINIPKEPPMFCMLLRKHLEGAKIEDIRLIQYERILEFHFSTYDEIGSKTPMCLAIELMGKHSNAILYNAKSGIITGSCHNISSEKSSVREVWGGIKYIYPPKQDRTDILRTSFGEFSTLSKDEITGRYYYLSRGLTDFAVEKALSGRDFNDYNVKLEVFSALQNLTSAKSRTIIDFWQKNIENEGIASKFECDTLNSLVERYFSHFVLSDLLFNRKNALKKLVNREIKRYLDIISNADKKTSYLAYKQVGELILANIYKIPAGVDKITLDGVEILMDSLKSPSENAQRYFALYTKGKTANEVLKARCSEAKGHLEYLNEIMFSIENADRTSVLDEIRDEINEFLGVLNPHLSSKGPKDKQNRGKVNVETIEYEGFTLYLGKNNKQNDYLIKKVSNPDDIWLHAKDTPSGHIIIKTENGRKPVTAAVLEFAARLCKENSPMKNTAKASIIYTKRKYLKRPPDTHLGYVTYREEREIVI